jgi:ketosteroid isomerase-like protein
VTEAELERWVEAYVGAWGSNDPIEIEAMFTEDAMYYTAPFRAPWRGRREIVDGWVSRKDEQGEWEFRFEVVAVAGSVGFVRGWTAYADVRYSNLWVVRLEDGRCEEFMEWWMEER